MRIRIALATAMAVTYMFMSFNGRPAAAQAVTGVPGATHPGSTAGSTTGQIGSSTTLRAAITNQLWPVLSGVDPPVTTTTPTAVSVPTAATTTVVAPPVAAPPPPVTPPPPPPPTDATSTDTTDWQCIRVHESGDVYNDPGRPSGAYGILESTWESFGFSGWPYEAAPAVQDALALRLYSEYGWNPWSTRYVCGL